MRVLEALQNRDLGDGADGSACQLCHRQGRHAPTELRRRVTILVKAGSGHTQAKAEGTGQVAFAVSGSGEPFLIHLRSY